MNLQIPRLLLASSLILMGSLAQADEKSVAADPLYVSECGSCHLAYPARLLPEASWTQLLNGLSQHFGADASLEAKSLEPIKTYLTQNARKKPLPANQPAPLRISELSWFRHEHDEISAQTLKTVGSFSRCEQCHLDADTGKFSEHQLRLPKS
jgi:hypothetical protein